MQLTPADRAKVAAAIRDVEARTDGEVIAIAAKDSDRYHDVVLHWSLLVALLPLALATGFPTWLADATAWFGGGWVDAPSLRAELTLLLGLTVAAFLAVRFLFAMDRLRYALTPAATKARRVRRRALILFRSSAEARTATRTGVLLYLSLAERQAEIVADASIHAKVAPELWGEAMAALIEAVRDGRPGDGIAAAIGKIGAVLATHFPHTGTDPNELPDRLIEL